MEVTLRRLLPLVLIGLVAAAGVERDPTPLTIHLAGDSTMAEKLPEKQPETGWGERLQSFFSDAEVRVENHARNGRSTRSFIEEGRWQALVERLREGDYVFIQFGHNDQSEQRPDRYTPPNQFQANLVRFVHDVRAHGTTPVLLTPVVRRRFDASGQFYDVHGAYPDLVRTVAAEHDVPLIDMHRKSEDVVRHYGAEASKTLFLWLERGEHENYPEGLEDNTHFSPAGAEVMARLAVEGIRELNLGLAPFLRQPDATGALQLAPYDAVVDATHAGAPGDIVDGIRTYGTIGEALGAVPAGNVDPFVVFIRNGRYYEKLTVDRPGVHLIGESREGTVLTYDAAAGMPAPGGGTYGTRGSYTLRITAPDFRAERLTIENGFDYPANRARADDDPAKVHGEQAVAVLTEGNSDRAFFRDCVISGHQDTLFADAGRHYFTGCTIIGNVDFIFGAGQAVFEDSDIVSRDRGSRQNNGYVTAASTRRDAPYGFLFIDSRLRKERPEMAPNSVALGRPWHPSADPFRSGSVVFIRCHMDDHISAEGWASMSSRDATGRRYTYEPQNARFFEYGSTGPGAVASPSRRVLTDGEVQAYTVASVLDGWVPAR